MKNDPFPSLTQLLSVRLVSVPPDIGEFKSPFDLNRDLDILVLLIL